MHKGVDQFPQLCHTQIHISCITLPLNVTAPLNFRKSQSAPPPIEIPNYVTDLLVVDLHLSLAYFMMTHPLPVAGKLPMNTLIARQ